MATPQRPEATPRQTIPTASNKTMPNAPKKTSGIAGVSGALGGAHAGGHSDVSAANKAEAMLQAQMNAGKVKDLNKAREAIAKKTGVWPNGGTN